MEVRETKEMDKLHTRNMTVSTYLYDEQRMIVEGTMTDERFHDYHTVAGEVMPVGTFHHMTLRLLVNAASLLIEDVTVEMKAVPDKVCLETAGCLNGIKGLSIAKGFTLKVKKLAGGRLGCTHLMELLLVMAPAAFQGRIMYGGRKPAAFNLERARTTLSHLVDTCHAWRQEGPFVERFKAFVSKR